MKVTIEALVIRDKRTNSIIDVTPLKSCYDEIRIEYTSDYVTADEIKAYVESWMGKSSPRAISAYNDIKSYGVWCDQQEAKDFSSVGNMKIGIETKTVKW